MTLGSDASRHYPTQAARRVDIAVHILGLALAAAGGVVLLGQSFDGQAGRLVALAVYAFGLVAMLSFSLAYNFDLRAFKPSLRRLDHVGIFLMIAGTYTPFTTLVLQGYWAWTMTIAVWTIAGLGIIGKALDLHLPDNGWTAIYIALGWLVLVAVKPIASHLSVVAIALLIAGGVVYTVGAIFYVSERYAFWRSIWHGHVVVAACCHWVAIFMSTS